MASYDPQRNRPRARPTDDEPAAVDALLDHDQGAHDDHHHGHDHHDHDHEGPSPAGLIGALGAAVLALVTFRFVRRRRRPTS